MTQMSNNNNYNNTLKPDLMNTSVDCRNNNVNESQQKIIYTAYNEHLFVTSTFNEPAITVSLHRFCHKNNKWTKTTRGRPPIQRNVVGRMKKQKVTREVEKRTWKAYANVSTIVIIVIIH